jgi:hypothetical protein
MAQAQLQERILVGGTEGTGKTYAWLTIARALPNVKFYVIDPDDGTRRVWYSEFPDVTNIEYYFAHRWFTKDFETYKKGPTAIPIVDGSGRKGLYRSGVADAWKLIKPKLKPGDWVIVEHLHLIWNSVQDSFVSETFDKEAGNYYLDLRKQKVSGQKVSTDGFANWNVINALHNNDFIIDLCFDSPAHVFMTTSTSLVSKDAKEDADIVAFYGESRIRFEGQKHNVFRVQTKLIFRSSGGKDDRKYIVNTFQKDRGREWLKDEELSDFYYQYLVAIAGW